MNKKLIFDDVKIIELIEHKDSRGFFKETYNKKLLSKFDISNDFVQDNESFSLKKNTLRGMHFQLCPDDQSKLIRVISGKIYDVFIDLRKNSPKYLSYDFCELTQDTGALYIPSGFAHGFLTLSDNTIVNYKVDKYYNKGLELGIKWNDPFFAIKWPVESNDICLSEKDNELPFWSEIENKVLFN